MTAPPAPQPEQGVRLDEVVRAVVGGVVEVLRAAREEVGRVKLAVVRSLAALRQAIVRSLLALLFVAIGAVVAAIFLVGVLNELLGAPWGTGAAAAILLALGGGFALAARGSMREAERNARELMPR